MKNLLSVTIDNSPKILKFIMNKNKDVIVGEKVVVESERGITIADVKKKTPIDETKEDHKFPEIIRVANSKDLTFQDSKKELEFNAKQYCLERIIYRNMKMKIVDVKYMLHASKVIFYFTADGRVDFRVLVKDLASTLKSRIEMRQIGVRDHAQIVGGIGLCGRELCCHSFMGSFLPISLDDAKKNGIGNSDKLIGVCGRFMCCLKFEGDSQKCRSCDNKPSALDNEKSNSVKKSYKNIDYIPQTEKTNFQKTKKNNMNSNKKKKEHTHLDKEDRNKQKKVKTSSKLKNSTNKNINKNEFNKTKKEN